MRIFNRAHVLWFIFVLFATIAACLLFIENFYPQQSFLPWHPPKLTGATPGYVNVGATPLGLIFGSISFAIFIFAGLLGLRKKVVLWRVGTVQRWLRAHIWLTLLTIPLVVLHTGFRLGGPMTISLIVLYVIVMVSGIYGLTLQHHLPSLMKERLSVEPVYEQIPHLRASLYRAAEKMRDSLKAAAAGKGHSEGSADSPTKIISATTATLAASSVTAVAAKITPRPTSDTASETILADFIQRYALPYLSKRRGDRMRLANPRYSEDVFRMLKLRVAEEYRASAEQIQEWCNERRMLDYQVRLHHRLHGWLFVHVPLSYLLILMTAWHAFVTLFRY
jgi:hypothetical protein